MCFRLTKLFCCSSFKVLKVNKDKAIVYLCLPLKKFKALLYLRRCYVATILLELRGHFSTIVDFLQEAHLNHETISHEAHNVNKMSY